MTAETDDLVKRLEWRLKVIEQPGVDPLLRVDADLHREAAAALADLSRRVEWQPIETAPKDGTPIFLLSKHSTVDAGPNGIWDHPPRAYIGVWNPEGDSWTDELGNLDPENGDICTLTVTGTWSSGGGWFQPNEVTHWMPLPAPPVPQSPFRTMTQLTLTIRRHNTTGLLAAMSDDLRGLLVTGRTLQDLLNDLPESIEELVRLERKEDVRVLGMAAKRVCP